MNSNGTMAMGSLVLWSRHDVEEHKDIHTASEQQNNSNKDHHQIDDEDDHRISETPDNVSDSEDDYEENSYNQIQVSSSF